MSAVIKSTALEDRYTWEAELPDGTLITKGGRLVDAVRVSIIPADGTGLSRVDLVGQDFINRFLRRFKRSTVGGFDKQAYFRQVDANATVHRKTSRAARDVLIDSGVLPKPKSLHPVDVVVPVRPQPMDEVLQVVCCAQYRFYIRHSDGTVLVTPPDYELWL